MRVLARAVANAMVVLLAASLPGSAQGTPTGDIHGRVVNAASNTSLQGIIIDVSAQGTPATVGRATSGVDGAFRITGLKPGVYHVISDHWATHRGTGLP